MSIFQRSAAIYDTIHAKKDYDGEAVDIDRLLSPAKTRTPFKPRLIDLGCGTGEFTRRFSALGWDAIGIDASEEMVAVARSKGVTAYHGEALNPPIRAQVEAVTCMFGAFSYMTCYDTELKRVLQTVRGMLVRGGMFAFDVIHLATAARNLREYSEEQFGDVQRVMKKRLEAWHSHVVHEITYRHQGEVWCEKHVMRAFSVPEIAYALNDCGFSVGCVMRGYGEPDDFGTQLVDAGCYYFTVIAEAA